MEENKDTYDNLINDIIINMASSSGAWTTPTNPYIINTTGNTNGPWGAINQSNVVGIANSGVLTVSGKNADIKINEHSLSDWMVSIEKRLRILVPKPELLEKYESLQQAYEHYKTLEALLYNDND